MAKHGGDGMSVASSNAELIGVKGSRQRLDTPCLVLDLDIFERNLAAMHGWARDQGIALRPHAKTHKCATIGKSQMQAGAIGLCCAKLGEAEALADQLPSGRSRDYGKPFAEVFKAVDGDFYAIDPLLFSPAQVTVTAVESGRSHRAGALDPTLVDRSFG